VILSNRYLEFDCILMDLYMPQGMPLSFERLPYPKLFNFPVDGEAAARYIKSTNNKNTNTPIIAVSAYSGSEPNESNNLFVASLSKPLQKNDLLSMPSSQHHSLSMY
jgi:serine/threonine-protein kinase RIM15